jgi:TatD DNase family protein
MTFFDTHTHLYLQEFTEDRKQVIQNALDAGVEKFFLPNIDSTSIEAMLKLEEEFPGKCYPMMGLHPCSVKGNYNEELELVEQHLNSRKYYAVGEIGIDLYWDKTFIEEQKEAFRFQIKLAKKHKLPIVIHLRNAFEETFSIVEEENDADLKGIFHCFTGSIEEARKIISLGGFKLGIGGVVTFKNSGLEAVLKQVDPKHLVLETDAPYLAPVPHRGKRNESAYIKIIAEKLAEIYGLPLNEVAEITTAAAKEIYTV